MSLIVIISIVVGVYMTKTVHMAKMKEKSKWMDKVKFFLISYFGCYIAIYAAAYQMLNK